MCMHIHISTNIHICTQPAASVFADVHVGVKSHMCNVHTCPCTSVQNTCSELHATLTVKKYTYIYTYTHKQSHTYAHEHTCACMTLSTRQSTDTETHNLCTNMHTHTYTHVYKHIGGIAVSGVQTDVAPLFHPATGGFAVSRVRTS